MHEILAPAGGKEQLAAAVRSGADAVYLGAKNFNARRSAGNFEDSELSEIVSYCHSRGVKVHLALNTLVMDSELPALCEEIKSIASAGADAVIVQDLGVLRLVREICPELEIHASTQMTLHNSAGVSAAAKLGCKRAVIARELSLDEIKKISAAEEIELEAFVHGALCMCMSGACYLSSMLGGRSGNRGLCAQPCRLDFKSGERRHALSLKDLSYINYVNELEKAGICSFKIEGRMKRPEYVAAAVSACKTAFEGGEPDTETLRAVFSRQGFTDGYLTGKRGFDMFGFRSKDDVTAAEKVLKSLALLYKDEAKRVPVSAVLKLPEGGNAVLKISDGENEVFVSGGICEKALKAPTDKALAERYICKTGGTPFFVKLLELVSEGELVAAGSMLNKMRRSALAELLKIREKVVPHPISDFALPETEPHICAGKPALRLRAEKLEQVLFENRAEFIILPLSEICAHPESVSRFGKRLVAELPALIFPFDEEKVSAELSSIKEMGLTEALCENIGAVELAQGLGFNVHGGHGLNVLNSVAAEEYARLGLSDLTLSFELAAAKIRRVGGKIRRGIIGCGYLPLMRTRACPVKKAVGCGFCRGKSVLTDRLGKEFTYLCSERKFGSLLNSVPLWIGDKLTGGVDFATLYFTIEPPEMCKELYRKFAAGEAVDFEHTTGLYYRELL